MPIELLLPVPDQFLALSRIAQPAQGLGLQLARPFPGDSEPSADFLQGSDPAIEQTEAELQGFSFPLRDFLQSLIEVLSQEHLRGPLLGIRPLFVGQ